MSGWAPSPDRVATPRVLFLVDRTTAFDALQTFSRDHAEAFRAFGIAADVVDVTGGPELEAFLDLLTHEKPRAIIGFGGIGADLQLAGRLLYDIIEVPYLGLMTDSPVYHPMRHAFASPWHALLFPDPDFLAASIALSPPRALRGMYRYGMAAPDAPPKPLRDRGVGLVYGKSGGQFVRERETWAQLPPAFRRVIEDVLAVALHSSRVPLWDLVKERIAADGIEQGAEPTLAFSFIVRTLDVFIRAHRATRFLEALLPFPEALVVGGDWSHVDTRGARARFVPTCGMQELLPLFDDARVVASLQPLMRSAPHERVIHGMQRGAVVVTDALDPLTTELGPHRFRPFDWTDDLGDVIADTLREPDRWQRAASEAAAFARADRSIARGARTVVTALEWVEALNAVSFRG